MGCIRYAGYRRRHRLEGGARPRPLCTFCGLSRLAALVPSEVCPHPRLAAVWAYRDHPTRSCKIALIFPSPKHRSLVRRFPVQDYREDWKGIELSRLYSTHFPLIFGFPASHFGQDKPRWGNSEQPHYIAGDPSALVTQREASSVGSIAPHRRSNQCSGLRRD